MNDRSRPISRQDGMTLPEAVLSLAVMAVMGVGFGTAISNSRADLRLTGAASELATLRAAGDRYVQDNFQTLVASAAGGPVSVSVATLAAQNYLPPSFPAVNTYGQAYQLYVRERSPTVLESIALTTGGTAMSGADGGKIALLLKASGGFTPVGSATVNGTNGGWSAPLGSYVPASAPKPSGNPAAYSIQYAVYGPTGALMRYATGNPADNQMTTALNMGGNNIAGAGNVGAQTVSLPSGGAVSMGSSYLYGDNSNTAIRQNAGFYVQDLAGAIKFNVDNGGNSWQPGNHTAGSMNASSGSFTNLYSTSASTASLQVAGNTNANQIYANGLSLPGGNTLSIGGSTFYGDGWSNASRQGGAFYVQSPDGSSTRWYVDPSGNSWQPGNQTTNAVYLTGGASAGAGCSPSGLQAQDGSGAILSCQNGAWTYPGSVPSGTVCGLSTNAGAAGYACMGYNATYGCPPGYGQMYWKTNFGNDAVYYCFKL
jgi:type II secretory pathway pseudopilin PulG